MAARSEFMMLFWCLLMVLVFPRQAWCYIDPGTGSYILQIVLATLFGALFAAKTFWRNVKSYLRGLGAKEQSKR